MKQQFFALALLCAIFTNFISAHAGDRTSVVENPRGGQSTITTDQQGTRTYDNSTGKNVYSSGGDRHDEQMQKSMETGGRVISDKR